MKRGVALSSVVIPGAISANSVQAAPVALAKSVTTVALAKGAAASASTLTLVKGVLKIMAWTKAKTAIVVGAGLLLAVGTVTVVSDKLPFLRAPSSPDSSWADDPSWWMPLSSDRFRKLPPAFIMRPTHFSSYVPFNVFTHAMRMGDKFLCVNAPQSF